MNARNCKKIGGDIVYNRSMDDRLYAFKDALGAQLE